MVATLEWDYNNAGAVNAPAADIHTVANYRFNEIDDNAQDLTEPVTIPSAGTKHSFWKHFFIHCTVAPDTQIDNLNFFSDGTLGWGGGVTLWIGDGTQTKTAASDAGYDPAVGLNNLTVHDTITTKTDVFATYTSSGSGRAVSISEASSIIDAVGEHSDYMVMNIELTTSATPGTKPVETLTLEYDEI